MKFTNSKQDMSDKESNASDSDFDEDDDPDKIEVPGGGKDLATAYALNAQEERPLVSQIKNENEEGDLKNNSKLGVNANQAKGKLPGGLIMKDISPGFEMVRTGSAYNPLQSTANMLGALGFPASMGGYPSMIPPNPAQFLQQSKYIKVSTMEALNVK